MPDSIVRWLEYQRAPLPYLGLLYGQIFSVCEGKQQQTCPVLRPCRHMNLALVYGANPLSRNRYLPRRTNRPPFHQMRNFCADPISCKN